MNNERVGSSDNKIVRNLEARGNETTIYGTNVSPTSIHGRNVPQNILFYRLHSKIYLRLRHNIHQVSNELQTEIINYDSRFSSCNKSEKLRWPIEDMLQIELLQ